MSKKIIEAIQIKDGVSEENVRGMFFKAYVNGDTGEIEQAINRAFGENTFQIFKNNFDSPEVRSCLRGNLKPKKKKKKLQAA